MEITFYGATQEVTGSKYVIESGDYRLLLDCGMHQGKRDVSNELNKKLPFEAGKIDAVILSHAHADHCGMIPTLVKEGFSGKIYCTAPTADITKFILEDAANIQKEDCAHYNKHLPSGQTPIEPIYTEQDVKKTFGHFTPVPYFRLSGKWTQLNENIRFKFYDAGHILGSAITLLEIREPFDSFDSTQDRSAQGENQPIKRLIFTGDLGRHFLPILRDPEYVQEPAQTLITECTYGDRIHRPVADLEGDLKKVVNEAISKKSKIIVPAFSLGRTQELLYILHKLIDKKEIPAIPMFVDSPLAKNITRVFQAYTADFDEEFWKDFGEKGESPFLFKNLITTGSIQESKSINNKQGPLIIIAGSGMCEGGRILHHLKNNIENPN
ncbi:MAG: MBL fold metallo-hydrolase, partial [Candidatus Wildermuthbacteria bacterium]|nr:MBL fold metallo-hydrolase [Candidatus Wildermuthbacteria bacterium]